MNLGVIFQILTTLPSIVKAIEAILASKEAQTLEQAISAIISHNTPGQPNSQTLSQGTDQQASTT